jgi:hypothetical protein
MLYVEKDLSAIVKAVFDHWDERKDELDGTYLQASNARVRPMDVIAAIKKGTKMKGEKETPTTELILLIITDNSLREECGVHPLADYRCPRARYNVSVL